MKDPNELQERLNDAESALAYILGAARGTSYRGYDSPTGRALDRLRENIEREATRVLPYLREAD